MPPRGLLCLASLIILAAFLALASPSVFAQPTALAALPLAQEAPPSEPQSVDPMDRLSAYLDWIRQETRDYRDALETDRQDFVDMAQFAVGLFAALVVVTVFGASVIIGQHIKDIRDTTQAKADAQLARIEEQVERRIHGHCRAAEGRVEAAAAAVQGGMQSLVRREMGYLRGSTVVFAADEESKRKLDEAEVVELRRLGLHVTSEIAEPVKVGVCLRYANLVLYQFPASTSDEVDPGLKAIVSALVDRGPETRIPFVVYFPGRVGGKNGAEVTRYPWATYANSLPMLVIHIFTLLLAFGANRNASDEQGSEQSDAEDRSP